MDMWLGLFIWLCGVAMGFAGAIIAVHAVKDDIEDEEAEEVR